MKILLLGSHGFLGQHLKKELLTKHELIKNLNKSRYIIDLSKPKNIKKKLKLLRPDLIINSAVKVNFKLKSSKLLNTINYLSVKKIVQYCKKNNIRLLQISGTGVHPLLKRYNKYSILKPKSFYLKTKLRADQYITKNLKNYQIVRFGGIFGDGGPNHLYINKLLNSKKKTLNFEGNLSEKKNYIHVIDASKFIMKLINLKKNGIFYSGGKTINFKRMLQLIKNKRNKKFHITNIKRKKDEIVETEKWFRPKQFSYYI